MKIKQLIKNPRIKKTRTCMGCRCLIDRQGVGLVCDFGFGFSTNSGIPSVPCYKPRSNIEWIEASRVAAELLIVKKGGAE